VEKAQVRFKKDEDMVHRDGACTASMARVATSTAIHWEKRAVALDRGKVPRHGGVPGEAGQ
jgi:hypothetical protein